MPYTLATGWNLLPPFRTKVEAAINNPRNDGKDAYLYSAGMWVRYNWKDNRCDKPVTFAATFDKWENPAEWLLPPKLGRIIIQGKVYANTTWVPASTGTGDELMAMVNNRAKYQLWKMTWDDSVQQARARQIIDDWFAIDAAEEFATHQAFADRILAQVKDLPEGVPVDPRAMPEGAKVSAPPPPGMSFTCTRKPVTIPDEEGDRLLILLDAEGKPFTGPKGIAVLGQDGRPLWVRVAASFTQHGALTWANAIGDGTKRAAYNKAIKNIPGAAKQTFGEQMIPVVKDGKVTDATTPGMSREAAEWASRERINVRQATREQLSNQGRRFSEWADKSLKFEQYFAKYLDRLYKITPEALEALKASDPAAAAAMERAVYKEVVQAAAKSRWWVSGSSKVIRVAGPVALIVGGALTAERIIDATDDERAIVIVDEAASWSGRAGGRLRRQRGRGRRARLRRLPATPARSSAASSEASAARSWARPG